MPNLGAPTKNFCSGFKMTDTVKKLAFGGRPMFGIGWRRSLEEGRISLEYGIL